MEPRPGDARRAFVLVLGAGALWGTTGVAAKLALETTTLDVLSLVWLRSSVAAVCCLVVAAPGLGAGLRRASRADLGLMALLGVVLLLNQWLYIAAVERIGVTAATLIMLCVPPVLVALVSASVLREALGGTLMAALGGALLGTALLVGAPRADVAAVGDALAAGVGFALAAALAVAAHAMGSRRIAVRHAAMLPLAVGFPFGVAAFAPVVLARGVFVPLLAMIMSVLSGMRRPGTRFGNGRLT